MRLVALLAPPPRKVRTIEKPSLYYTIHSTPNRVFGVRLAKDAPISVVGFKNYDDAYMMGRMLETHYLNQDNLPLPEEINEISLPAESESVHDMRSLFLLHQDTDDILSACAANFLQFVGVEGKVLIDNRYTWDATTFNITQSDDYYRERLGELFNLTLFDDR